MANIKRIEGKTGVSFQITVTQGRDINGKQVRHYRTWKPEGKMTERQMQKTVERAAADFEREIEQGYQTDNRQTFSSYARYVIALKRSAGIKERTLSHYEYLLSRCDQAIGHLRLCDIRPQHLNLFYQNLQEEGVRSGKSRATAKLDLAAFLKKEGVTRDALASRAGVSPTTITTACRKEPIMEAKADQISAALGRKTKDLFSIEQDRTPLSAKTVAEYHRFIHTVMQQAEDELLIPYNPAAKASAPKVGKTKPDFYEPDTVAAILDAAEQEPIKWKTMLHLFLITGRRREDICGLKWEKIDFENHIVCIDTSLLYLPKLGIYESTTKTENTTFLPLPEETMQLLREYRAWYNELRLKNGDRWQDSGFLFVKNNGAPIHPDSFAGWLRKFTKRHNAWIPAHKRLHADRKRRGRGHSRKQARSCRCFHNAGHLLTRHQRGESEGVRDTGRRDAPAQKSIEKTAGKKLPTVIFVRLCVKCAVNQNPQERKYAKKLEKQSIS